MDLTTHEVSIDYLKRTVPDPIYQELTAEAVVPDSLPDIDRILETTGLPILQEKRCDGGELQLRGGVQATVLYVPVQETEPQTLELWLPFSVRKTTELQDGCVIEETWLKSIDARVMNERKVSVRANLGTRLQLLAPEHLTLARVEPVDDRLQMQQNRYPVLLPVGCSEQEFHLQEELTLPETGPAIERILSWSLRPNVEESRMIGSKAVFKGDVVVEMMYLGSDQSINTYVGTVPYSQYAELTGEWPDAEVAVFPAITSAQLETDGQMESRTLLLDLGLLAQVCVIDRLELELTEDAYAPGAELEPEWQPVELQPRLDMQTLRQTAELTVPASAKQIVAVTAYADRPGVRRSGETVYVSGVVSGCVIWRDAEARLQARSFRGEASCTTEVHEDCRCYPACSVIEPASAVLQQDGIRVRVPVEFSLEICRDSAWKNLCGGTLKAKERRGHPSVIVCRGRGDSLWELAKHHGATVTEIREANRIEGEHTPVGEILLIPLR